MLTILLHKNKFSHMVILHRFVIFFLDYANYVERKSYKHEFYILYLNFIVLLNPYNMLTSRNNKKEIYEN